jgi:hypothetical protein
MMYYWNKNYFESLHEIAELLHQTPELEKLAAYCELRGQGLRQQALHVLRQFLKEVTYLTEQRQRELALQILEISYEGRGARQLMSHPLKAEFLRPVLRMHAPTHAAAYRYQALDTYDWEAMRQILEEHPLDELIWQKLISLHLQGADFAMHHLNESLFLGPEDECSELLQQAHKLLCPPFDQQPEHAFWLCKYQKLQQLFDGWEAYRQNRTGTFPQWCQAHGIDNQWRITVYYEK